MQFQLDQMRYKGVRQPVILSITKDQIFVDRKNFPLSAISSVFMLDNALIFSVGIPIKSEIVFRGNIETIKVVFNAVYGLCCGAPNHTHTQTMYE